MPLLPTPSNLWFDATSLMAVTDPILLPGFTVPGDETATLVLPAVAEFSQLPKAFAEAARRFTAQSTAVITFIDPLTNTPLGQPEQPARDHAWLLIDEDPDTAFSTAPSRIQWDNPAL
jgi:hypothetical protein